MVTQGNMGKRKKSIINNHFFFLHVPGSILGLCPWGVVSSPHPSALFWNELAHLSGRLKGIQSERHYLPVCRYEFQ